MPRSGAPSSRASRRGGCRPTTRSSRPGAPPPPPGPRPGRGGGEGENGEWARAWMADPTAQDGALVQQCLVRLLLALRGLAEARARALTDPPPPPPGGAATQG